MTDFLKKAVTRGKTMLIYYFKSKRDITNSCILPGSWQDELILLIFARWANMLLIFSTQFHFFVDVNIFGRLLVRTLRSGKLSRS